MEKKPISELTPREYNWYVIDALNAEKMPDENYVILTSEEREVLARDLANLIEERRKHPNMPLSYWPVELD